MGRDQTPPGRHADGVSMEVLRWLLFFAIVLILIVAALFWLMDRPLPFIG